MEAKQTEYVAYYRVSTREQGNSGLGLAAQQESVRRFTNCESCIIGEFTDVASGKQNNRPELMKAIAAAKAAGAKLLIAKLDRLSRNASFIFTLRDSKVDFVCCDMPDANTLTIGIFATLAQHERELISKRTKEALAAKKAQGAKLGSPQNLTRKAIAKGQEIRRANALQSESWVKAAYEATARREKGMSYQAIADELNRKGFTTRRGKAFQPMTVKRLIAKEIA